MLVIPAVLLLRSYLPSTTIRNCYAQQNSTIAPAALWIKNLRFCTMAKHNVSETGHMCTVVHGRRKPALRRSMYLYL